MRPVGLVLAENKTEAVLTTDNLVRRCRLLHAQLVIHNSQLYILYNRLMINSRVTLITHIEHTINKAAVNATSVALSVGDSRQRRRLLLNSIESSALPYGAAIWSESLTVDTYRKKTAVDV